MILDAPYFYSEIDAHRFLERLVWPEGPVCPHCGVINGSSRIESLKARVALRYCRACRRQFRATMGTIFERSHVLLHKWFQACFLLGATKKAINPHQLGLRLEVSTRTAIMIVQRINAAGYIQAPERARFPSDKITDKFVTDEEMLPWVEPGLQKMPRQYQRFVAAACTLGFDPHDTEFECSLERLVRSLRPNRAETRELTPN